MSTEVIPAGVDQKSILRNLLELYQHDFSEMDGADLDEHGFYGYPYLDHYWTEPNRFPFIFWVKGKVAGFALVRQSDFLAELFNEEQKPYGMAEFFVLRKYRRQGVGRAAARQLFDRFPGGWVVTEIAGNPASHAFWRRVIAEYTNGQFREVNLERPDWQGPVQYFDTRNIRFTPDKGQ